MRQTFTESKAGVKTTEFYVMVIFVAGVLLATYADQDTLAGATAGSSLRSPSAPTS